MDQHRMKIAQNAIEQIAKREGVSEEYVREQMKIAILDGFTNEDPQSRAYWQSIPREGEIPTPEEFILFSAEVVNWEP